MKDFNKEEILNQSRKENQDEGTEFIEKRGALIGVAISIILICVLSVIAAVNNLMVVVWALSVIANAFWLGRVLSIYFFTRKKDYLIQSMVAVVTILMFIYYFLSSIYNW